MNYTEQISLEQALDLQNRINAGEMPDILYAWHPMEDPISLGNNEIDHPNNEFYLTRPDYAQYIQGNKPLPDVSGGYGYANKPFGNGTYEGIGNWYQKALNGDWHFVSGEFSDRAEFNANFWEYCFQLTDLARVEAEADPKPSMPAHFTYQNDEWLREANKLAVEHEELKAKYSELEEQHNTLIKHLQEATASADAKQDRINELEKEVENYEAMLHRGRRSSQYFQEKNNAHCDIIKAQERLIELWKQASFIKPVQ